MLTYLILPETLNEDIVFTRFLKNFFGSLPPVTLTFDHLS